MGNRIPIWHEISTIAEVVKDKLVGKPPEVRLDYFLNGKKTACVTSIEVKQVDLVFDIFIWGTSYAGHVPTKYHATRTVHDHYFANNIMAMYEGKSSYTEIEWEDFETDRYHMLVVKDKITQAEKALEDYREESVLGSSALSIKEFATGHPQEAHEHLKGARRALANPWSGFMPHVPFIRRAGINGEALGHIWAGDDMEETMKHRSEQLSEKLNAKEAFKDIAKVTASVLAGTTTARLAGPALFAAEAGIGAGFGVAEHLETSDKPNIREGVASAIGGAANNVLMTGVHSAASSLMPKGPNVRENPIRKPPLSEGPKLKAPQGKQPMPAPSVNPHTLPHPEPAVTMHQNTPRNPHGLPSSRLPEALPAPRPGEHFPGIMPAAPTSPPILPHPQTGVMLPNNLGSPRLPEALPAPRPGEHFPGIMPAAPTSPPILPHPQTGVMLPNNLASPRMPEALPAPRPGEHFPGIMPAAPTSPRTFPHHQPALTMNPHGEHFPGVPQNLAPAAPPRYFTNFEGPRGYRETVRTGERHSVPGRRHSQQVGIGVDVSNPEVKASREAARYPRDAAGRPLPKPEANTNRFWAGSGKQRAAHLTETPSTPRLAKQSPRAKKSPSPKPRSQSPRATKRGETFLPEFEKKQHELRDQIQKNSPIQFTALIPGEREAHQIVEMEKFFNRDPVVGQQQYWRIKNSSARVTKATLDYAERHPSLTDPATRKAVYYTAESPEAGWKGNEVQAGHLLANRLGGEGNSMWNVFPQNANINQGSYRLFEDKVARTIDKWGEAILKHELEYPHKFTAVPNRIKYTALSPTFKFPMFTQTFDNIL
eukprot:TRINITY_DN3147_c0_g1_i2.p1 TRINITY_DN3147_c0_g1~~TRINITY_DN3147_c0_g1_i2.p1  ORF type:complete len:823 (+),score=65.37 TRINITY_DN3147_c0_g1_i2:42-2510(+)